MSLPPPEVLTIDYIEGECVEANSGNEEEEGELLPEPTFTWAVATLNLLGRYVGSSEDRETHIA